MQTIFIAIGSHCWAKGNTVEEAKKKAQGFGGPFRKGELKKPNGRGGWAVYCIVTDKPDAIRLDDVFGNIQYNPGDSITHVAGPKIYKNIES